MPRPSDTQCPRVLLFGIRGVYNYGCEAIVRGTCAVLREVWPDCQVTYASYRPNADRRSLADVRIRIVKCDNRYTLPRAYGALVRRLRIPVRPTAVGPVSHRHIRQADAVLSIGGDLYTLGGVALTAPFRHGMVEFGEEVLRLGRPLVVWAASVGPFDKWPPSVPYFAAHLSKLPLITVREPRTQGYLGRLGIAANVALVSDPAFLMPAQCPDSALAPSPVAQRTVAVNLSPLSARHTFGEDGVGAAAEKASAVLSHVLDNLDVNVLLVPHVACPWDPRDDDCGYLELIGRRLQPYGPRVSLLPSGLGARRTKGILAKCAAVVAARMHCAIAAMSVHTPTILIGYSMKALGMAEHVYGHSDWFVPLGDVSPEPSLAVVGRILACESSVRSYLHWRIPLVEQQARQGAYELRSVLEMGARQSRNPTPIHPHDVQV